MGTRQDNIFQDLFVLEMSNNHLGSLDRALRIVKQFSEVVHKNNVNAAIKVQFRDLDNFIHKDFTNRKDIYYVRKVNETKLSDEEFAILIEAIKKSGCLPLSTPFDNKSVDKCVEFGMPFIKVASSSCNDWTLLEKVASTGKPVIVSVGGATLEEVDQMVAFFENKNIPLAINHCICGYPHEDYECNLNQIDFLKNRYPNHVIGYSSHEYNDWISSISIAYAKGARTFERHVDINNDGVTPSKYCSLPHQIDIWFKAYNRTKAMCNDDPKYKTKPLDKETEYLGTYMRGVFAKRDLPTGHTLSKDDVYLAIPLQKSQISTREFWPDKYAYRINKGIKKDQPISIDILDTEYVKDEQVKNFIRNRGL